MGDLKSALWNNLGERPVQYFLSAVSVEDFKGRVYEDQPLVRIYYGDGVTQLLVGVGKTGEARLDIILYGHGVTFDNLHKVDVPRVGCSWVFHEEGPDLGGVR